MARTSGSARNLRLRMRVGREVADTSPVAGNDGDMETEPLADAPADEERESDCDVGEE